MFREFIQQQYHQLDGESGTASHPNSQKGLPLSQVLQGTRGG